MNIKEAIEILESNFKGLNIVKAEYFEDLDEIEKFSRWWKFTSGFPSRGSNDGEGDIYAVDYFTVNCRTHEIDMDSDFYYEDGTPYDPNRVNI
ncbi:MAG: hypothetical protein HWQ38_00725 [Nostoc sp. NMS7]|uniref:hypothetical protein n=1 Tax=Nostoc sp. NMS7 TaxID=2815391 RepID=UPI0025FBDD2D|nr:hypothetical protein [Nostoc sp. NMS7]MBN3945082.1 hypothetical protein [Nostoc sp. NMS7]